MTKRMLIRETVAYVGEKVKIFGWVNVRKDHGKLIFMDIRDGSGIVQAVVIPDNRMAYSVARKIEKDYAIQIIGMVKKRPGGGNGKIATECVEIEVESVKIVSTVNQSHLFDSLFKKKVNQNLRCCAFKR